MMVEPSERVFVIALETLCREHGFGRVMQLASLLWKNKAEEDGRSGAYQIVGPYKGETVPCGCDKKNECDWCCGSGWVTKRVSMVMGGDISLMEHFFTEYLKKGSIFGGFAEAILRNNLADALTYADAGNVVMLKDIFRCADRILPGDSWGSKRAVDRWVAHKGLSGLDEHMKWKYSEWL
jgi:hypothetical protein